MYRETKFYKCDKCAKIITVLDDSHSVLVCCGEEMNLLVANSQDAATEKHVPKVIVGENNVLVKVGSVPHPMTPEHYIKWIYIATKHGGTFYTLTPESNPEAIFSINIEYVVDVYEYCNLHGLWKADLVRFETVDDEIVSAEFTEKK